MSAVTTHARGCVARFGAAACLEEVRFPFGAGVFLAGCFIGAFFP